MHVFIVVIETLSGVLTGIVGLWGIFWVLRNWLYGSILWPAYMVFLMAALLIVDMYSTDMQAAPMTDDVIVKITLMGLFVTVILAIGVAIMINDWPQVQKYRRERRMQREIDRRLATSHDKTAHDSQSRV